MRVRDLGALVVVSDDREQPLVGTKGAALLALLAMNVNQRVSVDALMDAAWGDQVTAGSASTLESHIWRLRQLLEPRRDRRQAPAVLVNDSGGYQLVGGPASIDSLSFAESSAEVRDLLAAGHASDAVRRAEAALALWRGDPYGNLSEAPWAQAAVARLRELRGQLQERRIEALLAAGALDASLTELQPLIVDMPYRESLRALQMVALYRSGRGEQALAAYQEARRTLVDEVGIEPGTPLQDMHRRILRNDPTLGRPQPPTTPRPRPVEVHLPPTLTPLVGRGDVVRRLGRLVRDRHLVTVTGAAGCGKTRVAVDVAREAAGAFPDGVWFVDLTAATDSGRVVDVMVSTIGFAPSPGATPLQDLRRYVQTRRVLLVLDNCEHVLTGVDEVVRATLGDPGVAPECCFLATSREPINLDGETVWTLEPLGLPDGDGDQDPASAPAVELFLQRLAAVAPAVAVDEQALATVVDICVAVDGLPLPLELAAARAPSYTLDDIATQVAADPGRLGRIGRGPHDHRATVSTAIDWSYRLLTPREQQAHRRLSVLPGGFTAEAAAAVLDLPDGDELLARLVHRSMLSSESGPAHPGTAGRHTTFRQLATVRSHAQHALDDAGDTERCRDRRDAWTQALLDARPPLGTLAEAQWYGRIDDDYATVRATLGRRLVERPDAVGGRLACRLSYYWYYREQMLEAGLWLERSLAAAPDDHGVDRLLVRLYLASALGAVGRIQFARPHLVGLSDLVRQVPSARREEIGEALVALGTAAWGSDAHDLLVQAHADLIWVVDTVQSDNLGLLADALGSCALFVSGHAEEAVALSCAVQTRADEAGNPLAAYLSTGPAMVASMLANRPADGIRWVDRCMRMHLRLGTGAAGLFIENRANYAAQLGDYALAARMYAAARTETRRAAMVWPRRPITSQLLELTRASLSRRDYERAWQEGEGLTMVDVVSHEDGHGEDWTPPGVALEDPLRG